MTGRGGVCKKRIYADVEHPAATWIELLYRLTVETFCLSLIYHVMMFEIMTGMIMEVI